MSKHTARIAAAPPCTLEECDKGTFARGLCTTHYSRQRRYGDPSIARNPNPAPRASGPESNGWKGDDIGYGAAHSRVKSIHGRATQYACCICYRNRADHWAYDHSDSEELWENHHTGGYLMPFSTKPEHYAPVCKYCHRAFDNSRPRLNPNRVEAPSEE